MYVVVSLGTNAAQEIILNTTSTAHRQFSSAARTWRGEGVDGQHLVLANGPAIAAHAGGYAAALPVGLRRDVFG